MKNLKDKEQILMAFYAQYFKGATLEDIKQLDQRLSEGIGEERYQAAMKELEEEGLVFGIEKAEARRKEDGVDGPMATNEGMLYVNSALNLQSEAVEDHQLDYLENNLKTSGLEFTLEPVKEYIMEVISEQADKKPNENSP
ncbi:hypothetical protein BB776_01650 [Planococcus salinarum]|uniref:Uncharacterized protein n=1 Tax=Planococcus salinarum TaxID=622695 RepID=A0ABX3D2H4_9BACL|nr:hypothetical protein [Planococcus salinarum]OHX53879.1 hypothetical protein BB776_01650 [Planococcus salinarum]TAA72641.1 hypothetical protein D2909_05595 [Planococcus salinarum]